MKSLKQDWIIRDLIDLEYKQYQLLAYLKEVKNFFNRNKLYPCMSDLIRHYGNLTSLKHKRDALKEQFPRKVDKADLARMSLIFNTTANDDRIMEELEKIIDFAEPLLQNTIEEGKGIYELVEDQMSISTIGISSLYTDEGYFFMKQEEQEGVDIFKYRLTIITNPDGNLRGINSQYLGRQDKGDHETYKALKLRIAKNDKELDNPATYLITSRYKFPIKETLLPISQRKLVQYIHTSAA